MRVPQLLLLTHLDWQVHQTNSKRNFQKEEEFKFGWESQLMPAHAGSGLRVDSGARLSGFKSSLHINPRDKGFNFSGPRFITSTTGLKIAPTSQSCCECGKVGV